MLQNEKYEEKRPCESQCLIPCFQPKYAISRSLNPQFQWVGDGWVGDGGGTGKFFLKIRIIPM